LSAVPGGGSQHMNNTDKGLLTGAGLGAAAGALVGGQHGKAGAGALVGSALGAVAGGLTGAAVDNAEHKAEARAAARQVASLHDVVTLTQSGVSDDVIINQIRTGGVVYNLSAQDIVYLNNNGVREPVIRELQATAYRPPRHVYTAVPVAQPVYVVRPVPPPPPVGVGVGFTYIRR
jgi:hypothetical protein